MTYNERSASLVRLQTELATAKADSEISFENTLMGVSFAEWRRVRDRLRAETNVSSPEDAVTSLIGIVNTIQRECGLDRAAGLHDIVKAMRAIRNDSAAQRINAESNLRVINDTRDALGLTASQSLPGTAGELKNQLAYCEKQRDNYRRLANEKAAEIIELKKKLPQGEPAELLAKAKDDFGKAHVAWFGDNPPPSSQNRSINYLFDGLDALVRAIGALHS